MVRQFYIQLVGIICNPQLFWSFLFDKWRVTFSYTIVNMVIPAISEWNPWAHWEVLCEWESGRGDWEAEGRKQTTPSQLLRSLWLFVWHVEWIPFVLSTGLGLRHGSTQHWPRWGRTRDCSAFPLMSEVCTHALRISTHSLLCIYHQHTF